MDFIYLLFIYRWENKGHHNEQGEIVIANKYTHPVVEHLLHEPNAGIKRYLLPKVIVESFSFPF